VSISNGREAGASDVGRFTADRRTVSAAKSVFVAHADP
jgi:hypothetical protein